MFIFQVHHFGLYICNVCSWYCPEIIRDICKTLIPSILTGTADIAPWLLFKTSLIFVRCFRNIPTIFCCFVLFLLICAKRSCYHHLHWSLQQHLHLPVFHSVWSLWVLNMDQLYFGVLNFSEDILEFVFYDEISQSENVFFQGNFLHVVKKPTTIHSDKYAWHSFLTTI